MADFTNNPKNSSSLTNRAISQLSETWDEAEYTWDDAQGTWDTQKTHFANTAKNDSTLTNRTKN